MPAYLASSLSSLATASANNRLVTVLVHRAWQRRNTNLLHPPIPRKRRLRQTGLGGSVNRVFVMRDVCKSLQLTAHWNFCPQMRQSSCPTPALRSSLTVTDFSWLQKRQVNVVGRGSACNSSSIWLGSECDAEISWRLVIPSWVPGGRAMTSCAFPWRRMCTVTSIPPTGKKKMDGPVGVASEGVGLPLVN